MKITVTKTQNPQGKPDSKALGFGNYYTDHMFVMKYSEDKGWHDAQILPYGNLSLSPASVVFHYGAEIFEGLKAYRTPDGEVQLFRPWDNIARMNDSADRLCLPQLDPDEALEALHALIEVDKDWVPSEPGTSLYIRPFLFGSDAKLGLHKIKEAMFVIILSPVGSYYKEGLNPVSIMIESEDVRAVRGGTGYAKCGGNYAASQRASARAEDKGFSQVLWLDGVERKYIEEVGSMNVMFKIGGKVITPALTGSVLPGITRRSCITLMKDRGIEVEERLFSIDELAEAVENGTLEEAWGCGTAAVVSPVGMLEYQGKQYKINNGEIGALTQWLYDELTGIQWGKREDRYGWTDRIK